MGTLPKRKDWLRENRNAFLTGAVLTILGVFIGTLAFAIAQYSEAGTFGDTFGFATSLFAGLTLIFLVIAVALQREELQFVKEERDDTRRLLKGQEELNRLQKNALEHQIFEQSFFSLFSIINEEKARLLSIDTTNNDAGLPQTKLNFISQACSEMLLNRASGSKEEPERILTLDLLGDQAYNLINLLSSAVDLVDNFSSVSVDKSYYFSMIQGIVDHDTAVCFAWFHGSCFGQNKSLAQSYQTLAIDFSISAVHQDAMKQIFHEFKKEMEETEMG